MARIRSVHPDICQSETLAAVSAELERTFVRLWTHCDDEGRCEDRPKIIKAAIYPEHDAQTPEAVDEELTRLANVSLVIRYEVGGRRYLQVSSWDEYQHPQKPKPSKYPPPPGWIRDEDQTGTGTVRDGVAVGEGDGEGTGEGEGNAQLLAAFDQFWKGYPTRNGVKGSKKKAQAAWKALTPVKRQRALEALPLYAQAANGYPKDAERYLRDEMWDGLEPSKVGSQKAGSNGHQPFVSPPAEAYGGKIV